MIEHRSVSARAYRDGRIVCDRVLVTIIRDGRIGLAPAERRYMTARFLQGIDPALRSELRRLVRCRGARAARAAEALAPVELVAHDANGERQMLGEIRPPTSRFGPLEAIDFRIRATS